MTGLTRVRKDAPTKDSTLRRHSKSVRRHFTDTLQASGAQGGITYAICTDVIYWNALGFRAKQFKQQRNLARSESVRDHLPPAQLATVLFIEQQAAEKITRTGADSRQSVTICATMAREIAAFVEKMQSN